MSSPALRMGERSCRPKCKCTSHGKLNKITKQQKRENRESAHTFVKTTPFQSNIFNNLRGDGNVRLDSCPSIVVVEVWGRQGIRWRVRNRSSTCTSSSYGYQPHLLLAITTKTKRLTHRSPLPILVLPPSWDPFSNPSTASSTKTRIPKRPGATLDAKWAVWVG